MLFKRTPAAKGYSLSDDETRCGKFNDEASWVRTTRVGPVS